MVVASFTVKELPDLDAGHRCQIGDGKREPEGAELGVEEVEVVGL